MATTNWNATTIPPKAFQDIDAVPRDEEGLRAHYDVIICGTGLVQSILASALSRAGRSVLHCDAADYYGELDAVWTLDYCRNVLQQAAMMQPTTTTNSEENVVLSDDSFTLPAGIPMARSGDCQSLRIHSIKTKVDYPMEMGTVVATPYGPGKITSFPELLLDTASTKTHIPTSLTIELTDWKLAGNNNRHARLHVGLWEDNRYSEDEPKSKKDDDDDSPYIATPASALRRGKQQHYRSRRRIQKIEPMAAVHTRTMLNERSRSFALDVTPRLIYAAGTAVQGLLTSGVADYLEWKALEGILLMSSTSSGSPTNGGRNLVSLGRVPCNKNDIFGSKLLTPMEKRMLMKFLQLAMDYGVAQEATRKTSNSSSSSSQQQDPTAADTDTTLKDNNNNNGLLPATALDKQVQSLNERHLNQGRSLARPQNKAVSSGDMTGLEDCIARGDMDFETYLREKQRLSPNLVRLVRYALTLESSSSVPTTIAAGMKSLCSHMGSLGRFGTTAFLVPLYGSGELPQAFCRSAAVYGATYVLRRAPIRIVTVDEKVTGVVVQQGTGKMAGEDESPERIKQVSCAHVIAPIGAFASSTSATNMSQKRVLRRISILRGKLLGSNMQQRHGIIIPPDTIGNAATVHGLILDETSNVAPHVAGGCTVLHLTTTTTEAQTTTGGSTEDDCSIPQECNDDSHNILQRALDSILEACPEEDVCDEIFHVSFSYVISESPLATEHSSSNVATDDATWITSSPPVPGLHVVYRPYPGLEADAAFEQAATIFSSIVVGGIGCSSDFLALSKEMDDAVKERIGDAAYPNSNEPDEEQWQLESAVNIMKSAANSEPHTSPDKK
jgi:Rab proteins geranylgeranyltransferase component A